MTTTPPQFPYFIIEHQDNESFPEKGWSATEYLNILRVATPQRVIITNMVKDIQSNLHPEFKMCAAITHHSVLDFIYDKDGIISDESLPLCLRNIHKYHQVSSFIPTANSTTPPPSQVCFLDEFGTGPLEPDDLGKFQYIIVGGILGDHPSVDKCAYLRHHNFQVRHLGERQLSTDTAVLACCAVLRHGAEIKDLEYLDDPEVYETEIDAIPSKQVKNKGESTTIRMRYFTHQQSTMDGTEKQAPRAISPMDPETGSLMTEFYCMCECQECIAHKKATLSQKCNIDHSGDWYHSRPPKQADLYKHKDSKIARITPALLEHIFDSLNDGLFDMFGELDIDFETMENADDDKELYKMLFMGDYADETRVIDDNLELQDEQQ